jgi:hypothetical protein
MNICRKSDRVQETHIYLFIRRYIHYCSEEASMKWKQMIYANPTTFLLMSEQTTPDRENEDSQKWLTKIIIYSSERLLSVFIWSKRKLRK